MRLLRYLYENNYQSGYDIPTYERIGELQEQFAGFIKLTDLGAKSILKANEEFVTKKNSKELFAQTESNTK